MRARTSADSSVVADAEDQGCVKTIAPIASRGNSGNPAESDAIAAMT
jgi:hypothetical protein